MAIYGIKSLKSLVFMITGVPAYTLRHVYQNYTRSVVDLVRYRKWPMFRRVLIETSSFCNRRCKTCPVSQHPREKDYLDDQIFEDIVSELEDIGFSGEIGLHFFNEPLADKSIKYKVQILHKKLPNAFIYINSNGDYLTYELFTTLVHSGLNRLFVSQYDGKIHKHIGYILTQASNQEKEVLEVRVESDFMNNRAGSLDNAVVAEPILADCYLPSNQLVINYRGEVVICCNDYYGKVVLGRVSEKTLMEIWSGEGFVLIRALLKKKQRAQIKTCKKCNHLGNFYHYRDLTPKEIWEWNKGHLMHDLNGHMVKRT